MLTLKPPEGYDSLRAPVVSAAAAQLDTLLASLRHRMQEARVAQLEWQVRPGVNTVGMLLAHLGVSEADWVALFSPGIGSREAEEERVRAVIGIAMNDDGMPLAPNGTHPHTLSGKTVADYFDMLGRARVATHRLLRGWDDISLEQTTAIDGEEISRAWMLYHLVEHFAHHRGQITLLDGLRQRSIEGSAP